MLQLISAKGMNSVISATLATSLDFYFLTLKPAKKGSYCISFVELYLLEN